MSYTSSVHLPRGSRPRPFHLPWAWSHVVPRSAWVALSSLGWVFSSRYTSSHFGLWRDILGQSALVFVTLLKQGTVCLCWSSLEPLHGSIFLGQAADTRCGWVTAGIQCLQMGLDFLPATHGALMIPGLSGITASGSAQPPHQPQASLVRLVESMLTCWLPQMAVRSGAGWIWSEASPPKWGFLLDPTSSEGLSWGHRCSVVLPLPFSFGLLHLSSWAAQGWTVCGSAAFAHGGRPPLGGRRVFFPFFLQTSSSGDKVTPSSWGPLLRRCLMSLSTATGTATTPGM